MKRKLLMIWILSMAFAISGCAVKPFVPVESSSVVEVPGKTQGELFDKTRQWFSQYFVSGKSVIDYENKEAGTIIGNGIADIGTDPFGIIRYRIHYSIRIDTKDGKFRASTKIVKHTNTDTSKTYDVGSISEEREAKASAHVDNIVADITAYVMNKDGSNNSDW